MALVTFLRSTPGRVLRVAVGCLLIAYGATHMSLIGLILMMAGMMPAITGLASMCLLEDVASHEGTHAVRGHAREGRAECSQQGSTGRGGSHV